MKLEVLLWITAVRMGQLSRRHRVFRQRLKGKDLVIQMSVANSNVTRYFSIANGRIVSQVGTHDEPSLTLHFANEKAAYHVIKSAVRDNRWWVRAMKDKRLLVKGDLGHLTWFMEIYTYLPVAFKAEASAA